MYKLDTKEKVRKFIKYSSISLVFSAVFFGLMLVYVDGTEYVDIMDSLLVTGVVTFFFGWMFYVTNVGIFSLFAYGVQRFFGALLKRRYRTYEDMVYNRKKIDNVYLIALWFDGVIIILASLVMYLFYYVYII